MLQSVSSDRTTRVRRRLVEFLVFNSIYLEKSGSAYVRNSVISAVIHDQECGGPNPGKAGSRKKKACYIFGF